jgi:hypothetical protein
MDAFARYMTASRRSAAPWGRLAAYVALVAGLGMTLLGWQALLD